MQGHDRPKHEPKKPAAKSLKEKRADKHTKSDAQHAERVAKEHRKG